MKIALLLPAMLVSSCAIFLQDHEVPAINAIEIHEDPRVGDFAVLEDNAREFKNTWRVDKVADDQIDVSFIWEYNHADFSKHLHYLMTVTRDGEVLSARFKYSDDNIKQQPVAIEGGSNSRLNYESTLVLAPILASTPVGNFKINNIASYGLYSDIGGIAKSENTFTSELSNKVPFNVVKMYVTNTINKGAVFTALEILEDAIKVATAESALNAYGNAFKGALDQMEDNTLELEYTLTAFARGE